MLAIALILGAGKVSADPALTGTWRGTYSESVECGDERVTNSGAIELTIAATPGTVVTGIVVIETVDALLLLNVESRSVRKSPSRCQEPAQERV